MAVNLANGLAGLDDMEVSLVVYNTDQIDYAVDNKVNIISLNEPLQPRGIFNQVFSWFRKVRKIKAILNSEGYDYCISIMYRLNLLALMTGTGSCKKIITEHNVIDKSASLMGNIARRTKKLLYKKAYKVIAVSEGVKENLLEKSKYLDVEVIYNPIDFDEINQRKQEPLEQDYGRYILAAGRITEQKGFDLLIAAFSKIEDKSLKLIILGEGEDKDKLINLSNRLNVADRVEFPGFTDNPYKYMKNSECFVLSSRWEGFGLVIAEALASDARVVSFNCKVGPSEILNNDKFGILVEPGNVDELAKAIDKALTTAAYTGDKNLYRFSMESSIRQYRELLQ